MKKRKTDSVDLADILSLAKNESDKKKLNFALQSFHKRNLYSEIYYNEFIDKSDGLLGIETIDQSGKIRTNFEAQAVAFVANAHALIDSFPFVVFLTLKPLKYLKKDDKGSETIPKLSASESNWNDRFCDSLKYSYPKYLLFSRLFKSLMNNNDFLILRKMSNNNKHKFLTRIANRKRILKFELVDFDTGRTSYVDVKKFFIRLHNEVLPKLYRLYNELAIVAKGTSTK